MTIMKNSPWHLEDGWKSFVVKIIKKEKSSNLFEKINKSCVSLHRHSHGGVDTGGEGDVDEGHQDGDGLQHGKVLKKNSKFCNNNLMNPYIQLQIFCLGKLI